MSDDPSPDPGAREAAGTPALEETESHSGGDDESRLSIAVAVVGAETPGNVGTIARSMKNFGLSELLLVDPPEIDPDGEAYGFAGQAREDVLPGAREVTFEDLVEGYHTVGCTAITNEDETSHVRYPFRTPAELADSLWGVETEVCVVLGRERVGLTNEELARLDEVCSIPAAADYPVLNLGQAATVICYELRELTLADTQHPANRHQRADERLVERLHDQFETLLEASGLPAEKRPKATRMWRRLVGRAHPTGREATTLQGIFRRANQRLVTGESGDRGGRADRDGADSDARDGERESDAPDDPDGGESPGPERRSGDGDG